MDQAVVRGYPIQKPFVLFAVLTDYVVWSPIRQDTEVSQQGKSVALPQASKDLCLSLVFVSKIKSLQTTRKI